jgi:hypothetical protein
MNVYAVRITETKEAIGVYWVNSLTELYIIIDEEIVDPVLCEYAPLMAGGITFSIPEKTSPSLPLAIGDTEDDPVRELFENARFNQSAAINLMSELRWRPINRSHRPY